MYLAHSFGLKIVGHYVCVKVKKNAVEKFKY